MSSISVVIPVFNREKVIERTLNSLSAQKYRPINVIVVDNNCTDRSIMHVINWKAKKEAYSFSIQVVDERKLGPSSARNAGLRHVTTDWVMFFDSDDVMRPNHIERAMEIAEKDSEIDLIGWPIEINTTDGSKRIKGLKKGCDPQFDNVFQGAFSTLAFMAKTSLVRKAGGWDEELKIAEDLELGARLMTYANKLHIMGGEPTVRVFAQKDSLTTRYHKSLPMLAQSFFRIKECMPPEKRHWCDLQLIILGSHFSPNDSDTKEIIHGILSETQGAYRRLVFRFLKIYTRLGLRGAARIYRLLGMP